MASKALRGLTIEIGGDTTELNKALDKVDKRTKSLSSELGQINRALKLDPTNTELLAQKQKVLAEAISSTEEKLNTLKEAEKQVQEQFEKGEVSEEQVRALRREIIETERKLDGYKKAVDETTEAEEKLADGADEAGDELDEQADKTKKAEKASEDLDASAGDLAKGGLAAVAAAAAACVTAIVALAEESREYRTEMGKLDTAFQDAGFSAEAATKTYEALQGVLGETEQAVEAANHLAKLCTTEEELAEWTEIATGVFAQFGASLPIEGLTEAANETKRVGQVTGPLADALNWAAQEGETFGVKLKAATKANEEWNKKVKEATSAEDYFNLALQECSNEQERQQLITKTLTKLYGSAAEQYKRTNKEVIRANQVTEKWNKATAKIGKTVEPVVTDIKELGVALLEDAGEPLEKIANYIRKTVIPAIEKVGKWVKKNMPAIKGGLVGVATAMVAFEVASIAATVAQKGLKGAIMATTAAQTALNIAQTATPWGLIATAVVGLTAAMVAYGLAALEATTRADNLTEEERELVDSAKEAAEAFREQKQATEEAFEDISSQMGHVQSLADELRGLASASGKVEEKDRSRAKFILGELNEALGTEYTMTDGVIQKYDQLVKSIDEAIRKELAFALTAELKDDWITAQKEKAAAMDAVNLTHKDYMEQIPRQKAAEEAYLEFNKTYTDNLKKGYYGLNEEQARVDSLKLARLNGTWLDESRLLDEKKLAYEGAVTDYNGYTNTIISYEEAQQAALEGNYEKAIGILSSKGQSHSAYADTVDEETARALDTLYQEAVDAGLYAEWTRENFQNGVNGFSQPMVDEADENYRKAMAEFEGAYADAHSVGKDLSSGMTAGAESGRGSLIAKARSLVSGFIAAARAAADSHSPSRKMISFGEDLGAGAEIGVENKTKDVKRAATKQVGAVLDAYSGQEVNAQRALRSVAEQQTARQMASQQAVASANGPMLEKILTAIEKGQIITLDGDALVGATANRMDNALGRRRALASRGAI
jgi:hypothetical protein